MQLLVSNGSRTCEILLLSSNISTQNHLIIYRALGNCKGCSAFVANTATTSPCSNIVFTASQYVNAG